MKSKKDKTRWKTGGRELDSVAWLHFCHHRFECLLSLPLYIDFSFSFPLSWPTGERIAPQLSVLAVYGTGLFEHLIKSHNDAEKCRPSLCGECSGNNWAFSTWDRKMGSTEKNVKACQLKLSAYGAKRRHWHLIIARREGTEANKQDPPVCYIKIITSNMSPLWGKMDYKGI